MPRINYTAYRFVRPQTLSEADYISYKSLLEIDANADIRPHASYYVTFRREIRVIGMLIAIAALGGCVGRFTAFQELPYIVAFIALFIAFYASLSWLMSSATYYRMRLDSSAYYEELKKDMLSSDNYPDFHRLREGKEAANLYR